MKRRTSSKNRTGAAIDPNVAAADPEDRKKLARIEARMKRLLREGEAKAWLVGKLLNEIAAGQLHHADKFTSLQAYADARFAQGWVTLHRYRRVASAFTQATTKKHGVTKLYLGLLYIEATPEHERPAELPRLLVRVPDKKEQVTEVPFVRCTTRDLERAIALANARPGERDDVASAGAKRARARVQEAVAAPKGVHLHAPYVRAHPHPEHHGHVRFDIVGIDDDDLERVAKALLGFARAQKATSGKRRAA